MRIRIELGKHALELSLIHSSKLPMVKLLADVMAEHATEPNQGLTLIPPVHNPPVSSKPDVSSSETEVHYDGLLNADSGGTTLLDSQEVNIPIESIAQINNQCPCITSTTVCSECAEVQYHSGGCLECTDGRVPEQCYCTREGFVKCFECTIDSPHSPKCANCSPHTA